MRTDLIGRPFRARVDEQDLLFRDIPLTMLDLVDTMQLSSEIVILNYRGLTA